MSEIESDRESESGRTRNSDIYKECQEKREKNRERERDRERVRLKERDREIY